MNTFEDRLLTSLNADDEAFLKELEDDVGLFQQMGMTFSGPLRYWTAFAFVLSFAIFPGICLPLRDSTKSIIARPLLEG